MIFAHNLGMYDNTGNLTFASGISEDIPADSFIVALGHYAGQVGTSLQQAGTFMMNSATIWDCTTVARRTRITNPTI